MNLGKLKRASKDIVVISLIQIFFTFFFVFALSKLFQMSIGASIFLGICLTFSSSALVVKLFSDRYELNTLHARIGIGILLIQDIFAILILTVLSREFSWIITSLALAKVLFLGVVAFLLNRFVVKKVFREASKSRELLLVLALAFLFLFTMLAYIFEISVVVGAFLAGIMLSNLPYNIEIRGRIEPLRDFFAILFFVSIGMLLTSLEILSSFSSIIFLLILLLFVILVKPFIIAVTSRLAGYATRTSLLSGISLGQISEFSFIIILYALTNGIITNSIVTLVSIIGVVTFIASPYFSKAVKNPSFPKFFEKLKSEKEELGKMEGEKKTVLLVGCHRMGTVMLKELKKFKDKLLIVDFNPEIVEGLRKRKYSVLYGDIRNPLLLRKIKAKNLKVIISTIPLEEDNKFLINYFKKKNKKVFIAVTAERIHDALILYKAGADYVILPYHIGGEKSIELIKKLSKKEFRKLKKYHVRELEVLHNFLYEREKK